MFFIYSVQSDFQSFHFQLLFVLHMGQLGKDLIISLAHEFVVLFFLKDGNFFLDTFGFSVIFLLCKDLLNFSKIKKINRRLVLSWHCALKINLKLLYLNLVCLLLSCYLFSHLYSHISQFLIPLKCKLFKFLSIEIFNLLALNHMLTLKIKLYLNLRLLPYLLNSSKLLLCIII